MTERRILKVKKAAVLARVPLRTMYNWVKADKVSYVKSPTGRIRIYLDSVESVRKQLDAGWRPARVQAAASTSVIA